VCEASAEKGLFLPAVKRNPLEQCQKKSRLIASAPALLRALLHPAPDLDPLDPFGGPFFSFMLHCYIVTSRATQLSRRLQRLRLVRQLDEPGRSAASRLFLLGHSITGAERPLSLNCESAQQHPELRHRAEFQIRRGSQNFDPYRK